jgi:hypothetical protein
VTAPEKSAAKIEAQLVNVIARLSAFDFLLQFLYTAAVGTMTPEARKTTLDQITKLNETRHGPAAVAGLTNDPASARMFAQAKFTADNFVDRLRRDFGSQ